MTPGTNHTEDPHQDKGPLRDARRRLNRERRERIRETNRQKAVISEWLSQAFAPYSEAKPNPVARIDTTNYDRQIQILRMEFGRMPVPSPRRELDLPLPAPPIVIPENKPARFHGYGSPVRTKYRG